MTMTPEQSKAFRALQHALFMATECELFDLMAAHSHPDRINAFCDDFDAFAQAYRPAHILSFEQFVASREACNDIGSRLHFVTDQIESGYVYAGVAYINKVEQGYMLTIANVSVIDADLGTLERKLYNDFYLHEHASFEVSPQQPE